MFSLFQRKKIPLPAVETPPAELPKGLTRPELPGVLLATPRRQKLLEHIWQRTSLSRTQFATLYLAPLERYAALVQHFPASESHHHAYPGGMLDHGLEIMAYALKLRQSHLLPPGASPEAQAAQAEAWTAGVAHAALLHDIGKIAVDLQVELADGTCWHPWHGPLQQPYRFRYHTDRQYRLHSAATALLYTQIIDRQILDWLSGNPDLWAGFLYVMAGQYEHAGTLGEIVIQADQASVAQELGGDPSKALTAPRHALQRKLLDGLRYLLKEELKLNQSQASDGWLTQDALWLVSKTTSDKLRAYLLSQGMDGIPASNLAVFNVLQDHGIVQPTPADKAIWKATITSDNGWSHTFTLLKLSPSLIWENNERPAPFTGTVTVEQEEADLAEPNTDGPTATAATSTMIRSPAMSVPDNTTAIDNLGGLLDMFELPQPTAAPVVTSIPDDEKPSPPAPAIAMPAPTLKASPAIPDTHLKVPSGEHFMAWLRQGVLSHKIIMNDAKALVHTVDDTVYLVSPGLFQRYAQEHLQLAELAKQDGLSDWQWIQKRFEQLKLHRKQPSGLNIWDCLVTGPRKSRVLHGYLLIDPKFLLTEMPLNNPYLSLQ